MFVANTTFASHHGCLSIFEPFKKFNDFGRKKNEMRKQKSETSVKRCWSDKTKTFYVPLLIATKKKDTNISKQAKLLMWWVYVTLEFSRDSKPLSQCNFWEGKSELRSWKRWKKLRWIAITSWSICYCSVFKFSFYALWFIEHIFGHD